MFLAKNLETDKTQIILQPIVFNNLLLVLCISSLPVKYWGWANLVYLTMCIKGMELVYLGGKNVIRNINISFAMTIVML